MRFDFDKIYALYPRKGEGKKRGMDICARKILSITTYRRFSRAVENYAELCRITKRERKYTLMFSTFVGRWEDYEDLTEEMKSNGMSGNLGLAQRIITGEVYGKKEEEEE